jgi:glutamyl-tRNA synthetase
VGGARTALFNWLYARRNGGVFVLRVEDTDAARNTPEAVAAIYSGLKWLGLDWDEGPDCGGPHGPYLQSERQHLYDAALAKLEAKGLTYVEENGAVRFRSPRETVVLPDRICGEVKIDRSKEPDMTIRRPDGSYIFHFVNVVDDIDMRITHVIRGEDHIFNTGKHIELFRALDAEPPEYAHIPLILNDDGSKMSKRDQGAAVGYYVDNGFVPAAVRNYLCLLGWSPKDDREVMALEEIQALFDWEHLNHSNARFDMEKCRWMNGEYVKAQSAEEFAGAAVAWLRGAPSTVDEEDPRHGVTFRALVRLLTGGEPSEDEATEVLRLKSASPLLANLGSGLLEGVLGLIKPKVRVVPEIAEHLVMQFDPRSPVAMDAQAKVLGQADAGSRLACLAGHFEALVHWNAEHVQEGVALAAKELVVKVGALMFPLRVAVTGQGHGVDLVPLLVWLGKEETVRRLRHRGPMLTA